MFTVLVGACARFSQKYYTVDESAGHAILKVAVSGYRTFPFLLSYKVFVSSRFQPKAGKYHV